jgi:hypothetical protein
MAPQEKEALLTLGNSLAFAILVFPLRMIFPEFQCEVVFVALVAFIAILWIGRKLFGIKRKALDERDMAIRYLSGIIAAHVFGIVIMVGTVVLWMLHRLAMSVPIMDMVLLAYFGWLSMYLTLSVTVLILYRRGV